MLFESCLWTQQYNRHPAGIIIVAEIFGFKLPTCQTSLKGWSHFGPQPWITDRYFMCGCVLNFQNPRVPLCSVDKCTPIRTIQLKVEGVAHLENVDVDVGHREHRPACEHAEQSAVRRLKPGDVDQQPVL